MKDFKVASRKDQESKKQGRNNNKELIQEDDEQLVNQGKIMLMSTTFPPWNI